MSDLPNDDSKGDDNSRNTNKKTERSNNGDTKENHLSFRHFLNSNKLSSTTNNRNNTVNTNDHQSLPDFVQDHIIVESISQQQISPDSSRHNNHGTPVENFYDTSGISIPFDLATSTSASGRQSSPSSSYHATDEAKINQSLPDFLSHNVPKRSTSGDHINNCANDSNSAPNHSVYDYRVLYEQELAKNIYLQKKIKDYEVKIVVTNSLLNQCLDELHMKDKQLNLARLGSNQNRDTVNGQSAEDRSLHTMTSRANELVRDLADVIGSIKSAVDQNSDSKSNCNA